MPIVDRTLASRGPLDPRPPDGKHRRMMIHVKEAHLTVFLTHDEKERIDELKQFGNVEPPDGIGYLQCENDMQLPAQYSTVAHKLYMQLMCRPEVQKIKIK